MHGASTHEMNVLISAASLERLALSRMRAVEGWFTANEARALLRAACSVEGEIVEIGSYLGRSTVVLATVRSIWAIDPHEGETSKAKVEPTYWAFLDNLEEAGVRDRVMVLRQRSTEVVFEHPIGLLFIDGLHDYESVRADFLHFEPYVQHDGLVAFHDYDQPEPSWGVGKFVDQLLDTGEWREVARADCMLIAGRA